MANAAVYCNAYDLLDPNGVKTVDKMFKFYINELYINILQTNPLNNIARINYCMFLYIIQKQCSHVLIEARKINKKVLYPNEQYALYAIK